MTNSPDNAQPAPRPVTTAEHDVLMAAARDGMTLVSKGRLVATPTAQAAPAGATDQDGEAFRTAARLGLTLRFYGGCAQSSMPNTPSAYEVAAGGDRAAAMREAVQRAAAVIENGGESQRLDTTAQAAPAAGAVAGWNLGQPITEEMHVAAVKVLHRASGLDGLPQRILDAMLVAAPTPAAQADSVLEAKPACWIPPEYEGEYHRPGESITAYREPMEGWEPVYRAARKQGGAT